MYSLKKSKQIKWKCTLKTFLFNVIMIKTVSEISEPCVKNDHPHTSSYGEDLYRLLPAIQSISFIYD